ncbi:MAG: hypothetical protein ACI9OJ_005525, partial [Myxococcota bacterium]
ERFDVGFMHSWPRVPSPASLMRRDQLIFASFTTD